MKTHVISSVLRRVWCVWDGDHLRLYIHHPSHSYPFSSHSVTYTAGPLLGENWREEKEEKIGEKKCGDKKYLGKWLYILNDLGSFMLSFNYWLQAYDCVIMNKKLKYEFTSNFIGILNHLHMHALYLEYFHQILYQIESWFFLALQTLIQFLKW